MQFMSTIALALGFSHQVNQYSVLATVISFMAISASAVWAKSFVLLPAGYTATPLAHHIRWQPGTHAPAAGVITTISAWLKGANEHYQPGCN
jgi:hypothetical protein